MNVLGHLTPTKVFTFFEEICRIPHGSGNTKEISDYCAAFAKERNLWFLQDEVGNVVIKKPASAGFEASEPVILQGHIDMVLQQAPDNTLDLAKDGLVLGVDGDWIHANGTTLGGDNGIAVAYMLALLDGDYEHPPLECVFTIDEEIGLIGANDLDTSCLSGKRLINMDSEEEGIFTVGCAGGLTGNITLPVRRMNLEGAVFEIEICGLNGGHSGVEIHKERGNANKLMGRLLARLHDAMPFALADIHGGTVDNAIASACNATVLIDPAEEALFTEIVEKFRDTIQHELSISDPGTTVNFRRKEESAIEVLDAKSSILGIYLLNMIPNGVEKMSLSIKDLVETSSNLGVVRLTEEGLKLGHSIRSSVESEKDELSDRVRMLVEFIGGTYEVQGEYPGWEYEKNSELEQVFVKTYESMYGKTPVVMAIHAGLECGIFCGKIEGISCISIGPDMQEVHTPRERLSIASVGRTWEFVLEVLKNLK